MKVTKTLAVVALAVALFSTEKTIAQIQVSTQSNKQQEEIMHFDSTSNYITNLKSLKGQVLFVIPQDPKLSGWGYMDFYKYPFINDSYENRYGEPALSSKYNTKYEDLVGKYFIVDSIFTINSKCFLVLRNKNDFNDICCYKILTYPTKKIKYSETHFPFICLSYYNHLVNTYVNKEVVTYNESKNKIMSGVLKDILVDDNLVDNIKYTFASSLDTFEIRNIAFLDNRAMLKSKYNNLAKTYGYEFVNCVLKETIKVGMPEKLLVLSWGEPDRIHSSSDGSKMFVYKDTYVFIKSGRITSWED